MLDKEVYMAGLCIVGDVCDRRVVHGRGHE